MRFSDYQIEAGKTQSAVGDPLIMGAFGLAGEAGEVIDLIKKHLFHGHPLDHDKLTRECGDVFWYLACICRAAGIELDEVAAVNIAKLKARYGDEFSIEKSINRSERDE